MDNAKDSLAAFVGVCAFGGLRLGEAAGLKVSDVDFLRKEIRVSRQVQRAGKKQVDIFPPKYGSERTVYAPQGLVDLLADTYACTAPAMTLTDGFSPAMEKPAASELGELPVAESAGRGEVGLPTPRFEALLRLGSDQRRV